MARKVTQSDKDKWAELRNQGHTYEKIGKETGWGPETVRKYIGGKKKPKEKEKEKEKEPETDLELQGRAFIRFKTGSGPADLVQDRPCTADVAMALWGKYKELVGGSKLRMDEMGDKVDMLEDRVLGLEGFCATTLTNTYECPHCKVVGKVAVRFQCTACGHEDWMGYHPKEKRESLYKERYGNEKRFSFHGG